MGWRYSTFCARSDNHEVVDVNRDRVKGYAIKKNIVQFYKHVHLPQNTTLHTEIILSQRHKR